VSTRNEQGVVRPGAAGGRTGARHGLPTWARRRATSDPEALRAVRWSLHGLTPYGWSALHDVHQPGRPLSAIDHLVVGPGGVVVVDVQEWPSRGEDPGSAPARDARVLADRVTAAAQAAASVTALLAPRHRTAVRAVVCVADRDLPVTTAPDGTTVVGRDGLVAHLRGLAPRLHPADATGLAQHLGLHLGGTRGPDVLTTATLESDPRVARRRVVRPLTSHGVRPTDGPAWTAPDLPPLPPPPAVRPETGVHRLGPAALALRAGVVVSVAWLGWVFTTTPLGFG